MQNYLEDQQLITALQSGDTNRQETVFRQIYRQYYGLVESMVLKNSGQINDVADLFHDTMIVFFNKAKQPDFQLSSTIKTYIFAISRNLWLMKLKKNKKEIQVETAQMESPIEEEFYKTLELTERKKLIRQLIGQLGEECQKILELYYFRKMRMVQIQKSLALTSEQVAKNKKSKCLKRIRKSVMENIQYQQILR